MLEISDLPLCSCGCGNRVNLKTNKFIYNHYSRVQNVSIETRKKLSDINKGKKLSEEHKAKLSKSHKGKLLSDDHKRKIGNSNKGKKLSREHIEKLKLYNTGKGVSKETRKKLSNVNKGRKHSEETKLKMSVSGKGRKHSEETKLKISIGHNSKSTWSKGLTLSEEHKTKISIALIDHPVSIDSRHKMSRSHIKRIREAQNQNLPLCPCIGKKETLCLNELENICSFNIQRQYQIFGYFLDGFIEEKKLVVEFNETTGHSSNKAKERDEYRKRLITERTGWSYLTIDEKNWDNDKKSVIQQFRQIMKEQ